MKIPSLGAELFHAGTLMDGQTDLKNLVVSYRNFANAPENESLSLCSCKAGGRTQSG
jgi:hypothetical protein